MMALLFSIKSIGPSHADDLQYLFQSLMSPVQNWPDLAEDSEDEEFSKKLVSLWTSFAVNGYENVHNTSFCYIIKTNVTNAITQQAAK